MALHRRVVADIADALRGTAVRRLTRDGSLRAHVLSDAVALRAGAVVWPVAGAP